MSTRRVCPDTIRLQTRDPISGSVPKDMSYTVMRAPLIIDQVNVGKTEIRRDAQFCSNISASTIMTSAIEPLPAKDGILDIIGADIVDFNGAEIINANLDIIETCKTSQKGTILVSNGATPESVLECFEPGNVPPGNVLQYDPSLPEGVQWASLAQIGVCTGIHELTVGTSGSTLCSAPVNLVPGQMLAYDGFASQATAGTLRGVRWTSGASMTNQIMIYDAALSMPRWLTTTPSVANQCLCYNGSSLTWRNSPTVCTNVNQLTVGTGNPAPNDTTCVNPTGPQAGQMLSFDGATLGFTAGATGDDQVMFSNVGALPGWTASPTSAGDCLCYDGVGLVWSNIPEVCTGLNQITYGDGAGGTMCVAPTGTTPGQILSFDGGTLEFTTGSTTDNQLLVSVSGNTPSWLAPPTTTNQCLCLNSLGQLVWRNSPTVCNGTNQITVGNAPNAPPNDVTCVAPVGSDSGQLLSFTGGSPGALKFSGGYSQSNQILVSNTGTVPSWLTSVPTTSGDCLCYNGTNIVWTNLNIINPCVGLNQVTVGDGAGGVNCVAPTGGAGGQLLSYTGTDATNALAFSTGATVDFQVLSYNATTGLPEWTTTAPTISGDCLCYDGASLVWTNIADISPCTMLDNLSVGDGAGGITCLPPPAAGGILSYDGVNATLAYSPAGSSNNQVLFYNTTTMLPDWTSTAPTMAGDCLCYDGANLVWTNIADISPCTMLDNLSVGDGAGGVTCLPPPAAGGVLSYDGVNSVLAYSPSGSSNNQVMFYNSTTMLPDWTSSSPATAGDCLCYDGTNLVWTNIADISPCTMLDNLTVGDGAGGITCLPPPAAGGVLSYDGVNSMLAYSPAGTSNNQIMFYNSTTMLPDWTSTSPSFAGDCLCYDGANLVWTNISDISPCTMLDNLTVGDGAGGITCLAPPAAGGLLSYDGVNSTLAYSPAGTSNNQILFYNSTTMLPDWTTTSPSSSGDCLCYDGVNLVWTNIADISPCTLLDNLTVGDGAGGITCLAPPAAGGVLSYDGVNSMLAYSPAGTSNNQVMFYNSTTMLPDWTSSSPSSVGDCLCYNGSTLTWGPPLIAAQVCTMAEALTVGTGNPAPNDTKCVQAAATLSGELLAYNSVTGTLDFSAGFTSSNQVLVSNPTTGFPTWFAAPTLANQCLCYDGTNLVWQVVGGGGVGACTGLNEVSVGDGAGSVNCVAPTAANQALFYDGISVSWQAVSTGASPCTLLDNLTVGDGAGGITCLAPPAAGGVLSYDGINSMLAYSPAGTSNNQIMFYNSTTMLPDWTAASPSSSGDCLCYDGANLVWTNIADISPCTMLDNLSVGDGAGGVTCLPPPAAGGVLSYDGVNSMLAYSPAGTSNNQIMFYNSTTMLPDWTTSSPATAGDCLCYDGANLVWTNIADISPCTMLDNLTVGDGAGGITCLAPPAAGGVLSYDGVNSMLAYSPAGTSNNQIMFYNSTTMLPDWTATYPISSGDCLCYDGANLVWTNISDISPCTLLDNLTVGDGAGGISCLAPPAAGGVLSYDGVNSMLAYSPSGTSNNQVMFYNSTTMLPDWTATSPISSGDCLCYDGANLVWTNISDISPCTMLDNLSVGDGAGGITCLAPPAAGGVLSYDGVNSMLAYSAAGTSNNQVMFYNSTTMLPDWTATSPSSSGDCLCYDGTNLVWTNIADISPCTILDNLSVGDGAGGISCLAPPTAGGVLSYDGVNAMLAYSSGGTSNNQVMFYNSTTMLPDWTTTGGSTQNECLCVDGSGNLFWRNSPDIFTTDNTLTVGTGLAAPNDTQALTPATAGQLLSYNGTDLTYTTGGTLQNQVLFYNAGTMLPDWTSTAPTTAGDCLCYDGATLVWTNIEDISPCTLDQNLTIGDGAGGVTCLAPSAAGEILAYNGSTLSFAAAGSADNQVLIYDSASGLPEWSLAPSAANQCLCYDGANLVWQNTPNVCTGANEITVGTGLPAPADTTCVAPVGSNGNQLLVFNGTNVAYTASSTTNNQLLVTTAAGTPTYVAAPTMMDQYLCYDGANVVWQTIAAGVSPCTGLNEISVGNGSGIDCVSTTGNGGQMLTFDGTDVVFSTGATTTNQILYYDATAGTPVYLGTTPATENECLCYDGSVLAWTNVPDVATGTNELTVGTGNAAPNDTTSVPAPTTDGECLCYNGTDIVWQSSALAPDSFFTLRNDTVTPGVQDLNTGSTATFEGLAFDGTATLNTLGAIVTTVAAGAGAFGAGAPAYTEVTLSKAGTYIFWAAITYDRAMGSASGVAELNFVNVTTGSPVTLATSPGILTNALSSSGVPGTVSFQAYQVAIVANQRFSVQTRYGGVGASAILRYPSNPGASVVTPASYWNIQRVGN